MKVVANMLV